MPAVKPVPLSCAAVVVAAGTSTRMGARVRKPYLTLRGRPILAWTLSRLAQVPGLFQIVLVTRPEDRARAVRAAKQARLHRRILLTCAEGGARRQDSVRLGLRAVENDAKLVLIHDAARPFPPLAAMVAALAAADMHGGAILAQPVRDTVKREQAPGRMPGISETVPRAGLWLAHTPQIFRRDLIASLFERLEGEAPDLEVTDDAAVCEHYGRPVVLIESGATNLKITKPEDLCLAEAYLRWGLVK